MPKPPETIAEARRRLAVCPPEKLDALIRRLSKDPRAGVRDLAAAAKSRLSRERAEEARLEGLMARQRTLHELGFTVVAGIDEVGRGALAGPVTACAVVLAAECRIEGLDDSKKLPIETRVRLADIVRTTAVAVCVGHAEPHEIDRLGIGHATRLAWQRALDGLGIAVDHVLVDGNDPGALGVPTTAVVKGDASVACIAAASIVAKVERDMLMERLALEVPGFGFEENRGYGTSEHQAALRVLGPSAVHRRSFAPCSPQEPLF
jgi:ribonuclease HII